jgi:hypothetical protein
LPTTDFFLGEELDLRTTLINLVLVLVLGQILAWHYVRFSPVLSNKPKLARIFVFIAATTMLVISLVKTSLALSLGLVGALSIIRFRTPIKEPEELAYLFLAIGVGLGMGADRRITTIVVFAGILLYMGAISLRTTRSLPPRMIVHVTGQLDSTAEGAAEATLRALIAEVEKDVPRVDLRRVDMEGGDFNATLVLDLERSDQVAELLTRVRKVLPSGSVSVIDGNGLE